MGAELGRSSWSRVATRRSRRLLSLAPGFALATRRARLLGRNRRIDRPVAKVAKVGRRRPADGARRLRGQKEVVDSLLGSLARKGMLIELRPKQRGRPPVNARTGETGEAGGIGSLAGKRSSRGPGA